MAKKEQKRENSNMEIRKRNEARKLKRITKQKQKQTELRVNQQR